jgi:hypothetical protein
LKKDTKLYFSNFTINLHNFNAFNKTYGRGDFNYDGDTSQVVLNNNEEDDPTITAKKDSIGLDQDPESNLEDSFIEIIPRNKVDRFKLFYSYEVTLEELFNNTTEPVNDKNLVKWIGMTKYKQLKDSLNYFFSIPQYKFNDYVENEIKTRLNLKDSIIVYPGKPERIAALIYKRKPCVVNPNSICLRVERYVEDKRKDTKFIIITFETYD